MTLAHIQHHIVFRHIEAVLLQQLDRINPDITADVLEPHRKPCLIILACDPARTQIQRNDIVRPAVSGLCQTAFLNLLGCPRSVFRTEGNRESRSSFKISAFIEFHIL